MYQLSSIIHDSLPIHPKEILDNINHNGHLDLYSVSHVSCPFGSYDDTSFISLWTLTIRKHSQKVVMEIVPTEYQLSLKVRASVLPLSVRRDKKDNYKCLYFATPF